MAPGPGRAEHARDRRAGNRLRAGGRHAADRVARRVGARRSAARRRPRQRRPGHGDRAPALGPGGRGRARRRAARAIADPRPGLQDQRAGAAGQQFLGRLAHAPAAGARADVPFRPAAAGRADQPPGPGCAGLAGELAQALCRHADRHQPRPRIPRRRDRRDAAHRAPAAHALRRQLQRLRDAARAAAGAAAIRLLQAEGEDRAPAEVHRPLQGQGVQGQAGAKPRQGAGTHGEDRAGAGRRGIHVRVQGAGEPAQPDARDHRRHVRLRREGHPARRQPLGDGGPAHRHPGRQRAGQVHAGQDDRARHPGAGRHHHRRQGPEHRLLRAAGAGRAAPDGHAAGTHVPPGARGRPQLGRVRAASRTCATSWAPSISPATWSSRPWAP